MDPTCKRIGIIICYFGKLPWYFDYFIHSCRFNSTIDFFVITDDKSYSKPLPVNVKFYFYSLEELNSIASQKIGIRTKITYGYKLCDFKPTFGILFSELLKEYDFWGQSDIDVIYGNIRRFLDDRMLDQFDFINVRHDYTAGCFYLFRNTNLLNNIFKRSKDYSMILESSEHFCFDECNFAHDQLREGKSIHEIKTPIESFTHVIKAAEKDKEIKGYFDFILIEGVPGKLKFDNGRIIYKNTFEAILYHLIGLKQIYHPRSAPRKIPNAYYISETRIYS